MESASTADSRVLRAIARKGRTYVSLEEDRDWLEDLVGDPAQQLARMKKRGSLASVAHGRYVVLPPGVTNAGQAVPTMLLLAAAFAGRNDYYLGYLSALVEHRLTDEQADAFYVAVFSRDLPSISMVAGRPLRMTRILSTKKRFGIERIRAQGRAFYFRSDLERTLLDTLDRPKFCGQPDTWVRSWDRAFAQDRVDVSKLIDYASAWGGSVAARCAFWLRELGRTRESRLLLKSINAPLTGRRELDSSRSFGDGDWHRDRETGLIMNIPEHAITGWLEYGK